MGNRNAMILLSKERYRNLLQNLRDNNIKKTDNIPFLEMPFEINKLVLQENEIRATQNNIKYIVLPIEENTNISDRLRGYRENLVYIDKNLNVSEEVLYNRLHLMVSINGFKDICNANQFTYDGSVRFPDYVKLI